MFLIYVFVIFCYFFFFFSSRRRHTISVSAFLLNRSSDLHSFPKFFACLVRFESSSVPTTLPTAYDVYPLDGRHDGEIGRASCRERVKIKVVGVFFKRKILILHLR